MSRFNRIFAAFIAVVCTFFVGVCFSACGEKEKYSADKYTDVVYGEHERQRLDISLPKEKSGTVGLILFIHGGGWGAGDKSVYSDNLDKWSKVYGYATAAINYRYASGEYFVDDLMEDIALSLIKIKEFAAEKGYNIEKTMLTGSSAGGHLSLLYAYKYADSSAIMPVAVTDYSGPTDLTDGNYYANEQTTPTYLELFSLLCGDSFDEDNYLTPEKKEKMLAASPISYVNEKTVPTLICHGNADDVVPYSNAVILKAKLDEYGVENNLVTYNKSGHSLGGDKKARKRAQKLFIAYAEKYLG